MAPLVYPQSGASIGGTRGGGGGYKRAPRHTAQALGSKGPSAPGCQHRGRRPEKYSLRDDESHGKPCVRKLQAPRGVGSAVWRQCLHPAAPAPLGVTPLEPQLPSFSFVGGLQGRGGRVPKTRGFTLVPYRGPS
jgi:hypothetical protein